MIAFDKHLNFVLADTQEILRGDVIVSMSVEAPPPAAPIASEKVWNID